MRDGEKSKVSKIAKLAELTAVLEGNNLFEESDGLTSMTSRHQKASGAQGGGRQTKVDEVKSLIMGADKSLQRSRDRLASSMLLASDMKSGILHLANLLKMSKTMNELLSESSFGNSNHEHDGGAGGRRLLGRGEKPGKAMASALNSIEERLGQMVDVLDIVKQSRSQTSPKRRKSSNGSSPASPTRGKKKTKKKQYWHPSSDPELKPTQSNARPVAKPAAGPDGIVAPRRPVSRIIAMRRDNFDKYGSHTRSNLSGSNSIMEGEKKKKKKKKKREGNARGAKKEAAEAKEEEEDDFDLTGLDADDAEEEEEGWFLRNKAETRRRRVKEERRRAHEKEVKEREERRKREQRDRESIMQYEAALRAKQEAVSQRQMKAAQKRERLLQQQIKYSEEAAERKRQRLQKKSLRQPVWSKRKKKK